MASVRLDQRVLTSSLWSDRDARDVFMVALLLAEPITLEVPTTTCLADSLVEDTFVVPPGRYGIARSSATGLVRLSGLTEEAGMSALRRLCSPDPASRSRRFDGRRLARVDGGFLALNYASYQEMRPAPGARMSKSSPLGRAAKGLLDLAVEECRRHGHPPFVVRGPIAIQGLKRLIATYGEATSRWIVTEFFRDPPDWNRSNGLLAPEHIPAQAQRIMQRRTGPGADTFRDLVTEGGRVVRQFIRNGEVIAEVER